MELQTVAYHKNMMQHHHIWMNIYLAVTSEMKIPSKAMAFHLISLDIQP